MFTKSYDQAIEHAATLAPDLTLTGGPTKFFAFAETVIDLLGFIYSVDYDTVSEDLISATKEYQEYEDN